MSTEIIERFFVEYEELQKIPWPHYSLEERAIWNLNRQLAFEKVRVLGSEQLGVFVMTVINRNLESCESWATEAVDWMSIDDLALVVEYAVATLKVGDNNIADAVLARIPWQYPRLLSPHTAFLETYEDDHPRSEISYAPIHYEGSPEEIQELLEKAISQTSVDTAPQWPYSQAVFDLIGTKNVDAINALLEARPLALSPDPEQGAPWTNHSGLVREFDGSMTDIDLKQCYHLVPKQRELNPWDHPTYHSSPDDKPLCHVATGGNVSGICALCHDPLVRLLELNTRLPGLGITLDRITIAVCTRCTEINMHTYHQHDEHGGVTGWNIRQLPTDLELERREFQEITGLVYKSDKRWLRQDWQEGNMFKLGGSPSWVQDPYYPQCPECQYHMPMILQTDSDMKDGDKQCFDSWWGSGGLGYVFWCDRCRISAAMAQWT